MVTGDIKCLYCNEWIPNHKIDCISIKKDNLISDFNNISLFKDNKFNDLINDLVKEINDINTKYEKAKEYNKEKEK